MTRSLYLERVERPWMKAKRRQTQAMMRANSVRLVTIVLARSFGSTLAHIGRGLGLTKERVRQLERLAHHRARARWPPLGWPRGADGPARGA